MCIICLDFQKQKLTINEAWSVIPEMVEVLDADHLAKVQRMLTRAMDKEREEQEKTQRKILAREYDDA